MMRQSRVKIGLWGGNGGDWKDISELPDKLICMTISTADENRLISSIWFRYVGMDGQEHDYMWGQQTGTVEMINFGSLEYVKEISGTYGALPGQNVMVTSLNFVTTDNMYEFGVPFGREFSVPLLDGSRVVGFFGRACMKIDAIGVYVHP